MKHLLVIVLTMLAFGAVMAQNDSIHDQMKINTVVVHTSGDVYLRQGPQFEVYSEDGSDAKWTIVDSMLYLKGRSDYEVTLEALGFLELSSSGDVHTKGTLRADNLVIRSTGSGDVHLDLDYDYVLVQLSGSGDVVLQGHCDKLQIEDNGSGDVINAMDGVKRAVPSLDGLSELLAELGTNLERLTDSVDWESFERDMERWGQGMEDWGRHMEEWGEQFERKMEHQDWDSRGKEKARRHGPVDTGKRQGPSHPESKKETEQRSLLFYPHWSGFDAGLNMLLGPDMSSAFEGQYADLELKPLKSWNFNFNIVDVGIAFSRSHVAGLYTGVGLGWNNYSFNTPVRLEKGANHLEVIPINEIQEGHVKKSKLGVMYLQAPLMLEVRPTRSFFIAAGVTAGLRVDSWTKVKFMDKYKEKNHSNYYLNPLKLDATFRAGGSDMGFYASYNLLPLFLEGQGPTGHTFNVGFSLLF